MLLAVEGGGFFSSSASGYSKGLNLLLLGHNNEEKQMRVAPVYQETDPDLQLASGKNRIVRGCASLACLGGAAAGTESPCPLKVGPTQKQEILPEPQDFDNSKDQPHPVDSVNDGDSNRKIFSLKSSLKKSENSAPVAGTAVNGGDRSSKKLEASCEKGNGDDTCQVERRKVQWTDNFGGELFEIREFEMSDIESDDEFDYGNGKSCSCRIM